ncbi:MAG: hypothetical protein IPH66_05240 [Crocinitomicaceae bacterium]|nr:hypothetical protein [Crocinitomicaceae bacterium]
MAEETQYTANTGIVTISAANSNLDGGGTTYTLITGASNGTLVKSISIKAVGNTDMGMIRFYVGEKIFLEVPVPATRYSANTPTFETQVTLDMTLKSGSAIVVSTEKANTFNIFAEGMDWAYYASSVRPDTTQTTANNGRALVNTANSNLDGTGTLGTIYTCGTPATYKGSSIRSITIKSIVSVTSGMIRIFLQKASTKYLFTEVMVDTETLSSIDEAFERTILFDDDLDLQAGMSVLASTQVANSFKIQAEGTDWNYVA